MWADPSLQSALDTAGATLMRVDQCAFGTRHRKATGLAIAGRDLDYGKLATARCTGRHGRCGFTGRQHVWLQGQATTQAQTFPQPMAYAIARCVLSAHIIAGGT